MKKHELKDVRKILKDVDQKNIKIRELPTVGYIIDVKNNVISNSDIKKLSNNGFKVYFSRLNKLCIY